MPATLEGHLKYTSLSASGLSHQEGTAGRRKATYSLFVGDCCSAPRNCCDGGNILVCNMAVVLVSERSNQSSLWKTVLRRLPIILQSLIFSLLCCCCVTCNFEKIPGFLSAVQGAPTNGLLGVGAGTPLIRRWCTHTPNKAPGPYAGGAVCLILKCAPRTLASRPVYS